MENAFHHRLAAKEARQQRVTRSLRNMEDEANELVAFLDDQRDRRRAIRHDRSVRDARRGGAAPARAQRLRGPDHPDALQRDRPRRRDRRDSHRQLIRAGPF